VRIVTQAKQRVLILMDYYLPGEAAGGPVWTVSALVERLGGALDFAIVTRDRDLAAATPYSTVTPGRWTRCGRARCRYLSPPELRPWAIARLLRAEPHDVLYMNTLWSVPLVIVPLALRRLGALSSRAIIAPRGQLDPGALAIRRRRKLAFLHAAQAATLFRGIVWQASSPAEAEHIRARIGPRAEVRVAPNLRPAPRARQETTPRARHDAELRVVFLSRISEKKNLHGALEALRDVRADVRFDIYGPREDPRYWDRCDALMRRLPPNVSARYRGMVAHDRVEALLGTYDLLLLPTFGENYGHVVREALAAGCPVLISDRTPWRNLTAYGAGWDLPVEQLDRFAEVIDRCAREPAESRLRRSYAATALSARLDADTAALRENAALFGKAAPPAA
jgi:glycosyltransferase involved in cell wall biosynthesis